MKYGFYVKSSANGRTYTAFHSDSFKSEADMYNDVTFQDYLDEVRNKSGIGVYQYSYTNAKECQPQNIHKIIPEEFKD
jgi:hypothetical protein